jgi:thymidylate kinase
MVGLLTEPGMKINHYPSFIYITGCDGTGKSTQAGLLVDHLSNQGVRVKHLWLRYPFLFSIPFLIYARFTKLSWYEIYEGNRFGYWEFKKSRFLRIFFPWTLLLDTILAATIKIYIPLLLGNTIVCERFVIDILADLMVAFDSSDLYKFLPYKWFSRLLPKKACVLMLELDRDSIIKRRPGLQLDRNLDKRLNAFRQIINKCGIPSIENTKSIEDTRNQILQIIIDS